MNHVLNHLLQSTAVAVLAWLLTRTILRNNRARVRHGVWMAASAKFLLPFAVLADWGNRLGRLLPANTTIPMALPVQIERLGRSVGATGSAPAAGLRPGFRPEVWLFVWAIGTIAIAIDWFLKWRTAREARRIATPVRTMEGIPVLRSRMLRDRGIEPGVFGFWRPAILLPEGIEERLTAEELAAVLAHECCHARSRDNLAAAFHMVVEGVFWFYPPVWWMGNMLTRERERACDEEVLRGAVPAAVYAEAILRVCRFYVESPLRCVAGVSGADLKRRIAEIMSCRSAKEIGRAKRVLLTAAAILAVAGPVGVGMLQAPARAQTQGSVGSIQTVAGKKFDVATIKPGSPKEGWPEDGWQLGPPAHGGIEISNLELKKIVASSFRIQDIMVFGPKWMDSARFNIVAKGPDPKASNLEVWEMMRSLLADRFQLTYHIEERPMQAYVLTVAKGGPKLKDPATGRCADEIKAGKACGDLRFMPFGVGIYNMPIGALIGALGRRLQNKPYQFEARLPIVDKTGLTGKYDVDVSWMPEGMKVEELDGVPRDQRPPDVSLSQAMEQQAGLKLEAQKTPIPVVVVDRIEQPSAN